MESGRSIYFPLAAVYKRVRAPRTTARFDCTVSEGPVQRKCYENFGEQGRYYRAIGYNVEGTITAATIDMSARDSPGPVLLLGCAPIHISLKPTTPPLCTYLEAVHLSL